MTKLDPMLKSYNEMLSRIEDFSNFNTNYLKNLNCLFNIFIMTYIDGIFTWNINNFTNISELFF